MKLPGTARKYLLQYPLWRFRPPRPVKQAPVQLIGSDYGGYYVNPCSLDRNSIVYSLGVGEDITFDLALIQTYGLTVHAFDPTPKVSAWIQTQLLPEQFHFHDIGISDFEGEVEFHLPRREDFVSHSIVKSSQYSAQSIRVPMTRLSSAMRKLGHSQIDLLKMDIEGAEYGVLRDIVAERIGVRQICVEFHHRLSSTGTARTKYAVTMLKSYGLQLVHVCPRLELFTFLNCTG